MPEEVAGQPIAQTEAAPQAVTSSDATAAPEQKESQPVAKSFSQEQVDEIVAKRLAKESRRNERRFEQLLEKVVAPKEAPPQQPQGEPRRGDFDDYEKYIEARAEWIAEKKLADRDKKAAEEKQQAAAQETAKRWQDRLKAAEKDIPDIREVVEAADLELSKSAGNSIIESDLGPKIIYYLATHEEEALRIAGLPALSQVREIGKLELKLSTPQQKPKETSKAPDPITPVGGQAPSNDEPSSTDDIATWIRKRQRQVHGR